MWRVLRTTCDVMSVLSCELCARVCLSVCLGQLATPSTRRRRRPRPSETGNGEQPANTMPVYILLSSLFITFQVRPQGRRRRRRRRQLCLHAALPRPFSAGYFGKVGYLSYKRTANPLCHSEGPSARPAAAATDCTATDRISATAAAAAGSVPAGQRVQFLP